MTELAKPRREAERRERRRTEEGTDDLGVKLPIPDWVYDKFPATTYRHRWFRDEPGRIATKFKQDWDAVEGVDPVPGAHDRHGQPCNHILHIKHLDWYLQDRAKMEERRKTIVKQMERGSVRGVGDDAGENLRPEVSYADASNRLG